jgi:AcrR family transcriptional regulator
MATGAPARRSTHNSNGVADSRFDRRLGEILEHATEVFCDKGYEGASMRDLSRASGMSLAGMYYYFQSKERLLYLIQKHTFSTIVARLRTRLKEARDPEQRIRAFIQNHVEYFLANQKAMKVLSHEDEALKDGYGSEIAGIKREYYRICFSLVEDLVRTKRLKLGVSTRLAVLSLFGMMNWIYTWHNPRIDADARALARQIGDIFLHGILGAGKRAPRHMTRSAKVCGQQRT